MQTAKYALPVAFCVALLHAPMRAQAPHLGFPVAVAGQSQNPYTAPITTVIDHSTDFFYDPTQTSVLAYTGETGKDLCGPSQSPCGFYNPNFVPKNNNSTLSFIVNGSYVGANADCTVLGEAAGCPEQTKVLNYRGHSGYDYAFGQGTTIIAAQSGTLFIPAHDPINDPAGSDPWCTFHTFYIDHGNGWSTWYLHADHLTLAVQPHACALGTSSKITTDEQIGQVQKGQPIAVVGNFANGKLGGVGFHLHFEVRRGCDLSTGAIGGCMVVDPYGWEWSTADPISSIRCASSTHFCATFQSAPLWNLADWNIRQPLVSSVSVMPSANGFTATLVGQNFDPGAVVTIWDRQGHYHVKNFTPDSLTSTQIVVQLSNPPVTDPGLFLLKIRNPQGPRSPAVPLSFATGASSTPLVLNGSPAPGGGTFAGFAGFLAATDRGETVFSSGIDLNGDGAPDTFADFELSNGHIVKPSVAGFTNISSVAAHVRIDNRGDVAFGDVNGTLSASPVAIYILRAGASTPIQIAAEGGPCPGTCPITGAATLTQLTGPLAINDAGDVTFAASLLNSQTNITSCCYLFLYSGADGSIIKVAADGPSGDPTPVGGFFTQGALLPPINEITSDGDVVFLATVTGGSSQGGIFRFSPISRSLSKIVVQGDSVPAPVGGTIGLPLLGISGAVSNHELVFHAPVVGGTSDQIIGIVKDFTQPASGLSVVAFQGELTGTIAGGAFSNPLTAAGPNLPFGGFGHNTEPPWIRSDGSVVFPSLLIGAQNLAGTATDKGLFLWNGSGFRKLVVDGDPTASGSSLQGISATAINNVGGVFYFVASLQ